MHRYSTDSDWHVPHFEKMLYDQAQLAVSYLEAYQVPLRRSSRSVVVNPGVEARWGGVTTTFQRVTNSVNNRVKKENLSSDLKSDKKQYSGVLPVTTGMLDHLIIKYRN